MRIEDGCGSGRLAAVDNNHRLKVSMSFDDEFKEAKKLESRIQ